MPTYLTRVGIFDIPIMVGRGIMARCFSSVVEVSLLEFARAGHRATRFKAGSESVANRFRTGSGPVPNLLWTGSAH